jgi:hypothetical protein
MKNAFIFQFTIGDQPVFAKDGHFFISRYVDREQLAYGLFTNDAEGFEPISDMQVYEEIQRIIKANASLRMLSIVGISKLDIIVAVEFAGEYEYFRLAGARLNEISDSLTDELATAVNPDRQSSFTCPYVAEFKNGKMQPIK